MIQLQKPLVGFVEAITRLQQQGHRLYCATDTDGPCLMKRRRVQKLEDFFREQCGKELFDGVFIGSETLGKRSKKTAPAKGGLGFIEFILKETGAKPGECVMVGDKAETDLLPAHAQGISTILVPNPDYPCDWPVQVQSLNELPDLVAALSFGVFVSYCHHDEPFVRRVEKALAREGVKLWRDKRDAYVGDDLERTIIDAIQSNPGFLVVLTRKSIQSEWVQREIKLAAKGSSSIFPIVAEEGVPLPAKIAHRLYADCSGDRFAEGIGRVMATIQQRRDSGHKRAKAPAKQVERKIL
ncbi:MAG TPA: hypothetical protein DDZ88_27940 [Verrucomicrobiales bacterium]|nr:hypothetical protein [Verrucomicrobiales bacterium]